MVTNKTRAKRVKPLNRNKRIVNKSIVSILWKTQNLFSVCENTSSESQLEMKFVSPIDNIIHVEFCLYWQRVSLGFNAIEESNDHSQCQQNCMASRFTRAEFV